MKLYLRNVFLLFLLIALSKFSFAKANALILPPIKEWHGKSERLIQASTNPWQTLSEKSDLTDTPNYQQTFKYLNKLVASDKRLQIISIGKSPQGRDIWMVIATNEGFIQAAALKKKNKPTLLVQAGIHSGEIDGKDAGLMLLRDIIHGGKEQLLEKVNLLFVPILSVDAHERRSPDNRVNQRGPISMGWRTNSQNLNLNRDYSKLDTPELRHLIQVINTWQPDLYFDVHVTDGEDYQYDITYGFNGSHADSPSISSWLGSNFKQAIDSALSKNGHLGGPLIFGVDSMNFDKGIVGWTASPRYSNGYGDVRHLPTVLIENHSLKPYKQRVLGTYVMLEAALKLLAIDGNELIKATEKDRASRPTQLVVEWEVDQSQPEYMDFKGIGYEQSHDEVTDLDFIQWTGEAKTYDDLAIFVMKKPKATIKVASSYWIPPQFSEVIQRLAIHGIKYKVHTTKTKVKGTQLKVTTSQLKPESFEGRQMASAQFEPQQGEYILPANSIEVFTDQPLGRLAAALLDPRAPDSFFSWGFFNSIFQRTEYIESYALIPLAKKLFTSKPSLKIKFNSKKEQDKIFANDPKAQMQWIYSHSKYYDKEYLKYPIILELK